MAEFPKWPIHFFWALTARHAWHAPKDVKRRLELLGLVRFRPGGCELTDKGLAERDALLAERRELMEVHHG